MTLFPIDQRSDFALLSPRAANLNLRLLLAAHLQIVIL
jgi:hypothetical protein